MVYITWTLDMLERLKRARRIAVRKGMSRFWFDGHEFDVRYAHYLIEYLDSQLSKG